MCIIGCSAPTNAATGRRFRAADAAPLHIKRDTAHAHAMEPACPCHVIIAVRFATSLLPCHRRLGRGKTIVSAIPNKPVPAKPSTAKPSTAKPSAAKSPPTKPLPGERQLPNGNEGTRVPDSKSELPPVIRRTEVV